MSSSTIVCALKDQLDKLCVYTAAGTTSALYQATRDSAEINRSQSEKEQKLCLSTEYVLSFYTLSITWYSACPGLDGWSTELESEVVFVDVSSHHM